MFSHFHFRAYFIGTMAQVMMVPDRIVKARAIITFISIVFRFRTDRSNSCVLQSHQTIWIGEIARSERATLLRLEWFPGWFHQRAANVPQ